VLFFSSFAKEIRKKRSLLLFPKKKRKKKKEITHHTCETLLCKEEEEEDTLFAIIQKKRSRKRIYLMRVCSSDAATHAATLLGVGVIWIIWTREIFFLRRGARDVWDVIVNNDDICFKHIIPRLNSNDVKFLYGVNTETRKLIKRSSRASDLKERFKVEEMSSISTLEFVWENKSLWPSYWDELSFCYEVAETNKLELLKWAREEKKCEWDEGTINTAAYNGNLEMVKYCVANECPIDEMACAYAALNGHLECLKYLREEAKAPWDWRTAYRAARNGHLHILEYLVEREYDEYDEFACKYAAKHGQLDCLKFLHETAKAPWNSDAVREAHVNNQTECVQYLHDNNCPLPPGWRYEDGELHLLESETESE